MKSHRWIFRALCPCSIGLVIGWFAPLQAQTTTTFEITESAEDVEEFMVESSLGPAGSAYLDSSDLELGRDDDMPQIVGLRFRGIALSPGDVVTGAYVQFTVDEPSTVDTVLEIRGEASPDAAVFTEIPNLLSERPVTGSSVSWTPAPWEDAGQAGPAQQTPNLAPIVQEIIGSPGWQSGNAIVFLIRGEGSRVAESFDGSEANAPVLVLEYESGAPQLGETPPASPETAPTADEADTDASSTTEESEAAETVTTPEPAPTAAEEASSEPIPAEATPTEAAPTAAEDAASSAEVEPAADPSVQRRYTFATEGARGSLLVRNYGSGTIILTLVLHDQPVGSVYGATINFGDCDAPGTVAIELEPVRSDRGGLSVSSSSLGFSTLTQADLSLTIYPSASIDPGTGLACTEVGAP